MEEWKRMQGIRGVWPSYLPWLTTGMAGTVAESCTLHCRTLHQQSFSQKRLSVLLKWEGILSQLTCKTWQSVCFQAINWYILDCGQLWASGHKSILLSGIKLFYSIYEINISDCIFLSLLPMYKCKQSYEVNTEKTQKQLLGLNHKIWSVILH